MANIPSIGWGKQAGFGTAASTLNAVKLTDVDPQLDIERIENDEIFGSLDTFAPEQGTKTASVTLGGRAYAAMLGNVLQMAAGNPTTTGASAPYTHAFAPGQTLPPRYTIGLSETNGISTKVIDTLASSLTLTQDMGDVLKWSLDCIGTNRVAGAVTVTGTPAAGRAFRFDDFSATVDATADLNFKNLTITLNNPVSNIFTLNGTNSAAAQEYTGRRSVEVSGTLRFTNDTASYRAKFEANTSMALVLTWAAGDDELEVTIPDFRITEHSWNRGFDETEVDFSGAGYTDGSTPAITFNLDNSVASY